MQQSSSRPRWKKGLFALIGAVIALLATEGILRLVGYRSPTNDPYESFVQHLPVFEPRGDRYHTRATRRLFFHDQSFARTKAPGTIRIAVVGGSVTYGWGLRDAAGENYGAVLGRKLAGDHQARPVEVIHTGGLSYASYRLTGLVDELVGYSPDVIFIMTGHNEFLEPRHYADLMKEQSVLSYWHRSRLLQLLHHVVERMRPRRKAPASDRQFVLSSEAIDERYIVREATEIQSTLEHFDANIQRMLDRCQDARVTAVLCVEASNLRDFSPFVTEATAELSEEAMEIRFKQALASYEVGRYREALTGAEEVLAVAPKAAAFHYLAAKSLDALGDGTRARQEFVLAKDTDAFPHRSLTSFNDSLRRIARERQVPLYDTEAAFALASRDGIPGANLFLDNCHPTQEGHRLIAEGLFELLARHRPDLTGQSSTATVPDGENDSGAIRGTAAR